MLVRIVNKSKHDIPKYETDASAGMDLRANLDQEQVLSPMQRALISTGLFIELPVGFEAQVRMFPNMMNAGVAELIAKYKDKALGWKLSGAGGGGYLILVSEKPIENGSQILIRREID